MDADAVRERARDLPTEPGVYQFRAGETTLYVGKALDLRDRVRSYADPRSGRIRGMVERADRIEFAVTDTETQALLLEANLIKRLRPRYNVRLKDDKSYPLVAFSDHEVPRIEVTRDPEAGAVAYGPFTDVGRVETVVKAVRDVYGLRGCSDHKYEGRDRPCLDYEMGICSAPCTGEISPEEYAEDVAAARRFFEGETGVLADPLRRRMEAAAEANEFERAANLRDRLEAVEAFHGEGGEAVSDRTDDRTVDVLAAAVEGDTARVARLHSERGQLVDRSRHRLDAAAVEDVDGGSSSADANTPAAVLAAFLAQYYAEREFPDAVLLAERPADSDVVDWLEGEGVAVRVPGAGREAKLVELALKNARKRGGRDDPVGALGERLGIDRPERIEGFDVSHAQGTAVVGSDVCFVDGSAETADYRRKKLTERNDDYANMRELIRWRAERAVEGRDDRPDPGLLLIDGGDGQLGAARDALAETGWDVPVVALAKAEELVVTPTGTRRWDDDAPELHLLQRVRDEAHRFAVSYHQTVRDEVKTVLDDVPGVGPETRRRLLRRFGSVENVRDASRDDLTDVDGVGDATADTLRERL
ncbi:excinuclease ABC subunit C [Halorubrum distributum JCM 9100]|uniref:UvrABC system protein C n=2 Tax=Halorubrum distributum TaxID=29283 RepID=M0EF40_9EURY|nr:excinuclease ABC subunit C [Halorubrum distributum]ELZ45004.1 excinuclease ABC subunit C [Halorubrum distributum JCM 9100]ELZ51012.1 excinuclease ABC subunit C [Halorubrum distributum JCM 10118]